LTTTAECFYDTYVRSANTGLRQRRRLVCVNAVQRGRAFYV
jgi:hypothetical protein